MEIDNSILYGPCPCGSGSKFKFCCWPKCRNSIADDMTKAEVIQTVRCEAAGVYRQSDIPDADDLCARARDAFNVGDLERARPLFRQARMIDPKLWIAWNNEAVCLWEDGDVDHAYEVQRKGLEVCDFRNNFGYAAMAVFSHVLGRDDESSEWLEKTFSDKLPLGRDVVFMTCKALALFHRHRDIVDYTTASGMDDDGLVAFFKGTALANLGDLKGALKWLDLSDAPFYGDKAASYANQIRKNASPHSVCDGGWPYFWTDCFPPAKWFEDALLEGRDPFAIYPNAAADAIEVLVSDGTRDPYEMLKLVEGRPGERMERLRAELKRLDEAFVDDDEDKDEEEDAESSEPAKADGDGGLSVEEVKNENDFWHRPKWRCDYEPPKDGTAEDDARAIVNGLVRPYAERYCAMADRGKNVSLQVALVRMTVYESVDRMFCPSVTHCRYSQLWDVLLDHLEDFFKTFCDAVYVCEVRVDDTYGGPMLTLEDEEGVAEVFAVSIPKDFDGMRGQ
ncbi:MAG: tetratricopeptide repeat protein [Kiritimatiellae bacterium]|nr:tetratricopeptide repeat protein [Kiritimatiellia bacterium]